MSIAIVAGQTLDHVLGLRFGENGNAIVGLLAMDGDIIAKPLKGFGRKLLVDALDLLQAGDVRLGGAAAGVK